VLAKDAELRDEIAAYRNELMFSAIRKIDDPEWTICNAALQLFGAPRPKIVGQKQATELEILNEGEKDCLRWETAVVSFAEIANFMPETLEYIITYCQKHASQSQFTRSIILFLGFLSKLEHLAQNNESLPEDCLLYRLRELMWLLLQHREEKVRKLAALVFVRAHEFHYELPQILLTLASMLFSLSDENFFQGIAFVIQFGVLKLRHEALHTIESSNLTAFLQALRAMLSENYIFRSEFKMYTQWKLVEILLSIGFESESTLVAALVKSLRFHANQANASAYCYGFFEQLDTGFNVGNITLE